MLNKAHGDISRPVKPASEDGTVKNEYSVDEPSYMQETTLPSPNTGSSASPQGLDVALRGLRKLSAQVLVPGSDSGTYAVVFQSASDSVAKGSQPSAYVREHLTAAPAHYGHTSCCGHLGGVRGARADALGKHAGF